MRQNLFVIILFLSLVVQGQKSDFKHISFKKADSIANSYFDESLNNLPLLTYKLTSNLKTDIEKFRALYLWVSSNIEADYYFSEKTLRVRRKFKHDSTAFISWNSSMQSKMFKKLRTDKKTICSGYAYLLKELCALVDITCEIIDGFTRNASSHVEKLDIPNHSWNAVNLNEKWYFVDATLASGFFFVNENKFIKNYNDGYFLVCPELFIKSHYPLDYKWSLLDKEIDLDHYVKAPLIYGNTFKHNVIPVYPETLNNELLKGESILFKLHIPEDLSVEDVEVVLSNGKVSKLTSYHNYAFQNGILTFEHYFLKKGTYDLHVRIKKDVVVSYTVKVNKTKKEKPLS